MASDWKIRTIEQRPPRTGFIAIGRRVENRDVVRQLEAEGPTREKATANLIRVLQNSGLMDVGAD